MGIFHSKHTEMKDVQIIDKLIQLFSKSDEYNEGVFTRATVELLMRCAASEASRRQKWECATELVKHMDTLRSEQTDSVTIKDIVMNTSGINLQ